LGTDQRQISFPEGCKLGSFLKISEEQARRIEGIHRVPAKFAK
jgi:hypothetical protein